MAGLLTQYKRLVRAENESRLEWLQEAHAKQLAIEHTSKVPGFVSWFGRPLMYISAGLYETGHALAVFILTAFFVVTSPFLLFKGD